MIRTLFWNLIIFVLPKTPFEIVSKYAMTSLVVATFLVLSYSISSSIIFFSFCWDMAVSSLLFAIVNYQHRQKLLSNLMKLKDCSYDKIDIKDYIDQEQAKKLESESLFRFLEKRGLPWRFFDNVRIYCVDIGPAGCIPGGLGVFHIPFVEHIILIRDNPQEADAEEKFFLWHELSHSCGSEFMMQSLITKNVFSSTSILFILPFILTVGWRSFIYVMMYMLSVFCCYNVFGD